MRVITTILRFAISFIIGFIVMMFRLCDQSGGSGSASTSSRSTTNSNHFPNEIKLGDVWYRNIREVCTGEVEIRKGTGDHIEYVARKPNPVLHPNHYFIYDTHGNRVADFWNT